MRSYSWRGNLKEIVPVGLTAAGLRLDAAFEGSISEGELSGHTLRGIDYLLLRRDGVGVVDAREVVVLDSGLALAFHAEGYITPQFEMPPLEALLDPEFVWPDVEMPMHGAVRVETGAEELSAVNRIVYGFTGGVNVGAGTLHVEARALG